MLTEPQKKWVVALRSGKYDQGQGALILDGRYCCLGVACEVYQQEVGPLDPKWKKLCLLGEESEGDPTTLVRDWLGLTDESGWFRGKPNLSSLVALNDKGFTFAQIADKIEDEPEGLFVPCEK